MPGPGPSPTAFSTGPILNSGSNPATVVQLLISNENATGGNNVEVEVFEIIVSSTGVTKRPADHQLFSVTALQVVTRAYQISGFPAFEIQVTITGPKSENVTTSVFATDAGGTPIAAQRVLKSEMTAIDKITPVP